MDPDRGATVAWLRVWTRAVVGPAWRRAAAVWAGTFTVGGIVFGPTAMHPRDVTGLAQRELAVGIVLAVTWLLVILPIARGIVRAEEARYLRSLPSSRGGAAVVGAVALVGLQLPWVLLWLVGEGPRGLIVVGVETVVIALIASWRAPAMRATTPAWASGGAALRGVLVRALRRRAGDAILRGAGLAVLGGLVAGLFVRNNALAGEPAAVVGGSVLAVMLIPAQLGGVIAVADASRASRWLARSMGVASLTRATALASVLALVHVAAAILAVGAAALLLPDASTVGWLAITALVVGAGSALVVARAVIGAEDDASLPARVVVAAICSAAAMIAMLVVLRGPAGLLAIAVAGLAALWTVRA